VLGLDIKSGCDIVHTHLPDADRVFHLAAQTNAQSTDVFGDARTNVLGAVRVFERYGDKVVFASSSMVNYPTTAYAISKRAGERYAAMFGAAVVRFCNLFGEGGHSVVDVFERSDELTIRGSGLQLRTYAHVSEAVTALIDAKSGSLTVLPGQDRTVMQIAEMHPHKPRKFLPAAPGDLDYAPQVMPGVRLAA
jgi:nucleoside-diphosphate-sugar epimerase